MDNNDKDPVIEEFLKESNLEKLVNDEFKLTKLKEEFEAVSNLKGMTDEELYSATLDTPTYLGRYLNKLAQANIRVAEINDKMTKISDRIKNEYRKKIERHKVYDKNEMLEMIALDPEYIKLRSQLSRIEPIRDYVDKMAQHFLKSREYLIRTALEYRKVYGKAYFT